MSPACGGERPGRPLPKAPAIPSSPPPWACAPTWAAHCLAGSSHSGMEALLSAWDAVASGHAGQGARVLVVASDALVPGMGTAGEAFTGAAAVAYVLGDDSAAGNGSGPPARLTARATGAMPVVDRYRGDAQGATGDVYDGRAVSRRRVPAAADRHRARPHHARRTRTGPGVAGWAVADPDGKLASAVCKKLGSPLLSADVQAAVGDTGAAAGLLGAVPALAGPHPVGRRHPLLRRGTSYRHRRRCRCAPCPAPKVPSTASVAGRPASYIEAVQARGQVEAMVDPIPMGLPPGGAAFVRGNIEMLVAPRGTLSEVRHGVHPSVDPPHLHRVRERRARCGVARSSRHRAHLRRQPDHAASLQGAPAAVRPRPRGRRPVDGAGFGGGCGRVGHRRRDGARACGATRSSAASPSTATRPAAWRRAARCAPYPEPGNNEKGSAMSWNKVAVVGAGLIKFGELFDQSYEQMADGAFSAAVASVDKGFDPCQRRRRHRGHPAGIAVGPGGHRRQHRPDRHRVGRHPVHPGGERLPVGLRRLSHRRHGRGERRARRRARHRRREDARQVDPRRVSWPAPRPATRSTTGARPPRCSSPPMPPVTCTSSGRRPRCWRRWR